MTTPLISVVFARPIISWIFFGFPADMANTVEAHTITTSASPADPVMSHLPKVTAVATTSHTPQLPEAVHARKNSACAAWGTSERSIGAMAEKRFMSVREIDVPDRLINGRVRLFGARGYLLYGGAHSLFHGSHISAAVPRLAG